MLLIADGGSTKTRWCLLDKMENETLFETEGYHPFFIDSKYISESLNNSLDKDMKEKAGEVKDIFFYSTGGGYSHKTDLVLVNGLAHIFPIANIHIETDLLAAARSLLGERKGFAAILGTGTNTCIYDGNNVVKNIESLGFLLGDEGSGSYIGKKIIGDYIREVMPENVRDLFFNTFQLTPVELLNKVYEHPVSNRYCASFTRFVKEHMGKSPYYHNLVQESFRDFFQNIVTRYDNYKAYSFYCVGSIAYYFKEILEKVISEYGMKVGNIEREPMKGLIAYHQKSK